MRLVLMGSPAFALPTLETLAAGEHGNIERVAVEVEEMPGQSGGYARDIEPAAGDN